MRWILHGIVFRGSAYILLPSGNASAKRQQSLPCQWRQSVNKSRGNASLWIFKEHTRRIQVLKCMSRWCMRMTDLSSKDRSHEIVVCCRFKGQQITMQLFYVKQNDKATIPWNIQKYLVHPINHASSDGGLSFVVFISRISDGFMRYSYPYLPISAREFTLNELGTIGLGSLLLTWFNFDPSMDK